MPIFVNDRQLDGEIASDHASEIEIVFKSDDAIARALLGLMEGFSAVSLVDIRGMKNTAFLSRLGPLKDGSQATTWRKTAATQLVW